MDPLVAALSAYFRYETEGLEHIPLSGPGVIVSPHGLLPIDGVLLGAAALAARGRRLHGMSHPYWFKVPLLRGRLRARGFEVGTRGAARRLLQGGHLLHTMPGGVAEAFRGSDARGTLRWEGRTGYLRLAVRADAPVIPAATVGIDGLYTVTEESIPLTGRLFPGLKAPIPRAYGLGPLPWPLSPPRPVPLLTRVGAPVDHGLTPEALEDPAEVEAAHRRVQAAVLALWGGG